MSVSFSESKTKENLMRAFAGESQARNRYTFAAKTAKKNNLHVVEAVFTFTASQEEAHAKVFYDFLKELTGENITVDGTYPVEVYDSVSELLLAARHDEMQEAEEVYVNFANVAKEEGFNKIAAAFDMIAKIEKTHADRFGIYAELLEAGKLFVSDIETHWMCLNCGHIFDGKEVPEQCPVCSHDKGFFVRLELAPYTKMTRDNCDM